MRAPEYRRVEEQDVYSRFLVECCERKAGGKVRASDLYHHFKEWFSRANPGAYMPSSTAFGTQVAKAMLDGRRLTKNRVSSGMMYEDIQLLPLDITAAYQHHYLPTTITTIDTTVK